MSGLMRAAVQRARHASRYGAYVASPGYQLSGTGRGGTCGGATTGICCVAGGAQMDAIEEMLAGWLREMEECHAKP